jgi:signal transduction histidine kinase
VPQDITRVLLNLISNGFYAAVKQSRDANGAFRPMLKVTTCDLGEAVEVRVRDNGTGIPPEYRDRLFGEFTEFTIRLPRADRTTAEAAS